MAKQRVFNMYETVRMYYIEKHMGIFEKNYIHVSKKELEEIYYFIPQKETDAFRIVIPYDKLKLSAEDQKRYCYYVFERVSNNSYTLIPKDDMRDQEQQVLFSDNFDGSLGVIDSNVEKLRNGLLWENSKADLDKEIGYKFDSFKRRFTRHINSLLSEITGISNVLELFKINGQYQFTVFDFQMFTFLYDTYETQGKHLLKYEYEKLSPDYVEILLRDMEIIIEDHCLRVNWDFIKNRLTAMLLKAEKGKLLESLSQLELRVKLVADISEAYNLAEKIEFVRLANESLMECYQKIFQKCSKYLCAPHLW